MEIAREPEDPHSDLSKKSCSCGFPSCIVWCRDCSEPLCDTCLAAHRRVTLTKTHQMLDHTPANPSHVGTTLCLQHPSEKLKLYCLTCKQYTCRDCQLSSAHMNHSYQFVTEAVTDMKSQLRTMLQPIRALRHKLKQTLKDLKTRLSDIISGEEKLLAELENSHNYCAKILANRVQFLREQIKNVQKTEMHQVQTNIEKLQQLQVKQLKAEKLLKKSLVVDDLTLLVNLKAQVETEMKSVSEEDVALPALMKEIEVTTNMYAVNALSNLGFIQISDVPFCISTNTSGHETGPAPILPSTLGTKQGSSLVSGLGTSAPLGAQNQMVTNQDPAVAKNLCLLMIQSPAPTNQGPAPTNQGPASTNQGPASTNQGPASTNQGPASTKQGPRLTHQGPASTNQGPVSTNQGPASTDQSQAIKKLVQMLMIQGSLAIHQNPRLTNQSPRLTNQSPRLTNQGPASTNQGPASTNQGPASTNQGPASTNQGPASTNQGPASTNQGPASTNQGPASTNQGPASTNQGPASTNQGPVSTNQGPRLTNQGPASTNQGPVSTNQGPALTNQGPVSTNQGPRLTNQGPRLTNQGPASTNQGPVSTNQGPRLTNQGPRSTNQGPASTNQGPVSTNQGPRLTNQGPASTNQGPRLTNQGPASTNQGPRLTNQGPASTNQGPASTNQGPAMKKLVQMLMIPDPASIHQNPRLTNQGPRLTNQGRKIIPRDMTWTQKGQVVLLQTIPSLVSPVLGGVIPSVTPPTVVYNPPAAMPNTKHVINLVTNPDHRTTLRNIQPAKDVHSSSNVSSSDNPVGVRDPVQPENLTPASVPTAPAEVSPPQPSPVKLQSLVVKAPADSACDCEDAQTLKAAENMPTSASTAPTSSSTAPTSTIPENREPELFPSPSAQEVPGDGQESLSPPKQRSQSCTVSKEPRSGRKPSLPTKADRTLVKPGIMTSQQGATVSQMQPRLCLHRLPPSMVTPGRPVLLVSNDSEDEEEGGDLEDSQSEDPPDFTRPLSSPDFPDSPLPAVCSVCRSAGCLLICSSCHLGFHPGCHVPPAGQNSGRDWTCSLCQDPSDLSDLSDPSNTNRRLISTGNHLSVLDQRRCEILLLHLLVESRHCLSQDSSVRLRLTLISDRLALRLLPAYQTSSEFLFDIWSVFRVEPQGNRDLDDLRQIFYNKSSEVFGSDLSFKPSQQKTMEQQNFCVGDDEVEQQEEEEEEEEDKVWQRFKRKRLDSCSSDI